MPKSLIRELNAMGGRMKQIKGRIDPLLKARIDWLQEYIDWSINRGNNEKDYLLALFNKKMALVERI